MRKKTKKTDKNICRKGQHFFRECGGKTGRGEATGKREIKGRENFLLRNGENRRDAHRTEAEAINTGKRRRSQKQRLTKAGASAKRKSGGVCRSRG